MSDRQVETPEPTMEQLANFAAVLSFGPGYTEVEWQAVFELISTKAWARETWLARHRELQAASNRPIGAVSHGD